MIRLNNYHDYVLTKETIMPTQKEIETYLYNEYIRYHSPKLTEALVKARMNECRGLGIDPTKFNYIEVHRIVDGKSEIYFAWSPWSKEQLENSRIKLF